MPGGPHVRLRLNGRLWIPLALALAAIAGPHGCTCGKKDPGSDGVTGAATTAGAVTPQRWDISSIVISDFPAEVPQHARMSMDDVRNLVRDQVKVTRRLTIPDPELAGETKNPARLRVELSDARESARKKGEDHGILRVVAIRVRLQPTGKEGGENWLADGLGEIWVSWKDSPGPAGWKDAMTLAMVNALNGLDFRLGLMEEDSAALVQRFESSGQDVREQVLEEIERRKLAEAIPALARRLNDPQLEQGEQLRIIGVLNAIGDPAGAGPVAETVRMNNVAQILQVIPVLERMGGPDAEGFLFVLSTGHHLPVVRRQAIQSLEAMRNRSIKSSPPVAAQHPGGAPQEKSP
ncbi:MAG: hypothetical protein GMKNLPBB_01395 [Myxococcota bacterium]|nr:hypothetical protein [Myxococcota bacterium]